MRTGDDRAQPVAALKRQVPVFSAFNMAQAECTGSYLRWLTLSLYLAVSAALIDSTATAGALLANQIVHAPSEHVFRVALGPGTVERTAHSAFAPSSPFVLRAQQLLQELDLYRGPVDGRSNDDTQAAVRTFQRRSGLEPDGRIDEALLSRLEFAGQAGRLVSRLDATRRRQQEQARQALASTAATRALLSGTVRLGTADPARNLETCVSAPSIGCLLTEAIESAKAIHRPHFRDWVLGEVVTVQARTGRETSAIATAGLINDPRLVIVALKRIVEASAGSDRIGIAAETAAIIPDAWLRTEARIALVSAYLRRGRWGLARKLAAEIADEIDRAGARRPQVSMLVRLANTLSDGGSITGATHTLERALVAARLRQGESGLEAADLAAIAAGFARLGRTLRAQQLLSTLDDATYREAVLIDAAYSRALTGDLRGAREFAVKIGAPRYRAAALVRVAEARQGHGRERWARAVLPDALRASLK